MTQKKLENGTYSMVYPMGDAYLPGLATDYMVEMLLLYFRGG